MNKKPIIILLLVFSAIMLLAVACKQVSTTEYYIDASSCNACGECVRICPNDAIYFNHLGNAEIDQTKCTKCARCVAVCPNIAIY